ncbi:helix-turn-helix transcriptional regulator [Porticoccaceae bacterium LTM1]|nr:helix-turn-helix transcriptional regulator [Porticoccaceae bacterium LTM1]
MRQLEPHIERLANASYPLGLQWFPAAPLLRRFVCHYWLLRRADNGRCQHELLHPENGSGIVFHLGGRLVIDGESWQETVVYTGSHTRTLPLEMSGEVQAFGVRFKPGGAAALSGAVVELKNQYALLSELGCGGVSALHQQLAEASSAQEMVVRVESWLLRHLRSDYELASPVMEALGFMADARGMVGIESVAEQLSLGRRSLERMFRNSLGITPKECTNAYRIGEARHLLMSSTESGADIANQLGYSDQAHFIRQFRQVVGLTPSQYRQRDRCQPSGESESGAVFRRPTTIALARLIRSHNEVSTTADT